MLGSTYIATCAAHLLNFNGGGGGGASKSNTCDEDMNLITPNSVVQDIPTSADHVYTL